MSIWGKKEAITLFVGDTILFYAALWLTLLVRYKVFPDINLFREHAVPFSLLFVVWIIIFFIAGLYDKHTTFFKERLSTTIFRTQTFNIIIAALFFFLIPYFGIAPKTNLLIYLFVSSGLIVFWRMYIFPFLENKRSERAILISDGAEMEDLYDEVNKNSKYGMQFVLVADKKKITKDAVAFQGEIMELIASKKVSIIVADTRSEFMEPLLPLFYNLSFLHADFRFIDSRTMYEEIFDKVPLSLLRYDWFLMNVSHPSVNIYAFIKRAIDIIGGSVLGLLTLLVLPFVYVAIKFEDNGPVFIKQKRIGQYNTPMTVYKFRTMDFMEHGVWLPESKNKVTKVGNFLRKTSLDEFPQFINILLGGLSMVGPRSDIVGLGHRLADHLSYYNIRYIIKPGLSGWAQINQYYLHGNISPQSLEENEVRLSYDFYYIKHRSILLDIIIILKTFKRLFLRQI